MATASNNRTFGVTYSGSVNNSISNFTTVNGRLHVATGQDIVHSNNYANVQWVAGPAETASIVAYIKNNAESMPTPVTTVGVQAPGGDGTTRGTADAYIGFHRVSSDAEYVQAILAITAAQGDPQTFTGTSIDGSSTAAEAKTWADNNLTYWSNYTVTEGPGGGGENPTTYNYYTVTRCGGVTQNLMKTPSTGMLFAIDQGYDLTTVNVISGSAPGDHIVIIAEASEGTADFEIDAMPQIQECTA